MEIVREWWVWLGWRRIVAAVLAVPIGALIVWWMLRLPTPPIEHSIPMATTDTTAAVIIGNGIDTGTRAVPGDVLALLPLGSTAGEPVLVAVHVVGAVRQPGVYHLPPGSRGDDAVRAAGGALESADLRRVNLAAPLIDGEQLLIPRVGERLAPTTLPARTTLRDGGVHAGSAIIDINAATASQLESLPGIGPAIARAIVEHRAKNGPFATVDDLLAVRGIGPAKLAELRAHIRV